MYHCKEINPRPTVIRIPHSGSCLHEPTVPRWRGWPKAGGGEPFKSVFAIILILSSLCAHAQNLYQISGVEIDRAGRPLSNAWTGGFNNPVISPIDLDQDGMMDLFIYDKAGWKALAFINTGSFGQPSYRYAPEYDMIFPSDLRDWAVVRDFNKDGIPDIFALTSTSGISVYQGYRAGGVPGFTKIISHLPYTFSNGSSDFIYSMADNMPVIADIDGDGDLDILAQDIVGVVINYYLNQSQERGYGNDSLIYTFSNECWGAIYENSGCGVSFISCKDGGPPPPAHRDLRDNGGTLFSFDYQADHDADLLLADLSCNSLKFFRNDGDSSQAIINQFDSLWPSYDRSVKMPLFPAAFGADVDNDSYDDMLISPYASNANYITKSEDIRCIQFYQNKGAVQPLNSFHYHGDSLLTSTTVDVGTESHAVFFDYNSDSLMDIVVGNFGRFVYSGHSQSSLALYRNTGTATMPHYAEVSNDWSGLSAFSLLGIYPAFGDMDGDGLPDMVIGEQTGHIHFFKNAGDTLARYPSMTMPNWFGINIGAMAAPYIYDLNGDGLNDLIIGSTDGRIRYYWNFGTDTLPLFSPDSVNNFLGAVHIQTASAGIQYSSPIIHRENGSLVLYSGSLSGVIMKYAVDTDSLRHGSFALLDQDVIGIRPGMHSSISIADINGDGHNDYLTGNVRGGMMLFSDAYWGNGRTPLAIIEEAPTHEMLQIFPNPASQFVKCKLPHGEHWSSLIVTDMLGEIISLPYSIDAETTTISLSTVKAGIYIVRMTDEQGNAYVGKISVTK